jgi:hypothetical protein
MLGALALAQTQIDLRTQGRDVDFSSATSTKPMQTGAALPSSCSAGQLFFLTGAPAGQSLYACVVDNDWAPQGAPPAMSGFANTVLSNDGTTPHWTQLGGDLGGVPGLAIVQGLRQRTVASTAPLNGQALVWSAGDAAWEPQTVAGSGGNVTWQNNGAAVGARAVVNVLPGFGLITALSDTGTAITVQQSVDSGVIQTKADYQTAAAAYCASNTGSPTAYGCSMTPTLSAYVTPLALYWLPDTTATPGPVTLNVDLLGATPLKLSDGVTDPAVGDIIAGTLYPIWYDGTSFRLMAASTAPRMPIGTPPTCTSALQGRMWLTPGATGVKDVVAVCAKDATDAFAWRTLY